MGRTRTHLAGALVVGLMATGLAGIVAAAPAGAAGCTITLTDTTSYTGTDAAETVCIDGTGSYTVDTAGGNDSVKVIDAAASVDATLGDGNDIYTGTLAAMSTVEAGAGDDKVTTGSGADSVDGGTGADLIATKDGDDTVIGGTGNDRIVTGNGADTVEAGTGDDKVATQDGNDAVSGEAGVDNLNGGNGDDALDGGADADRIAGAAGDDDLSGGDGSDKVNGGTGDDTLDGNAGADLVAGANGVDVISGGADADVLAGGDGDDAFDGTEADSALGGAGDAACSDLSELNLACVRGAVVASVDHSIERVGTGWRVTVRARALDFDGVGVTKIALAEHWNTTPEHNNDEGAEGMYRSAVPILVSGTPQNGVFESVFDLPHEPATGTLGVRVFTQGFTIERWLDGYPTSWPCISWSVGDSECGFASTMGAAAAGFPKRMSVISFDSPVVAPTAPSGPRKIWEPTGVSPSPGMTFSYSGYMLVPYQTPAVDRTNLVFDQQYIFDRGPRYYDNCRAMADGHTFAVRTFVVEVVASSYRSYGWSMWSDGSKWKNDCGGTPKRLVVNKIGRGSVFERIGSEGFWLPDPLELVTGASINLMPDADPGYLFVGWSGGGCTGTAECGATISADTTITATFVPAGPFTLSVERSGGGSGSVSTWSGEIQCGDVCSASFPASRWVTLYPTPDSAGSVFAGWEGSACSGTGPCTLRMTSDVSVKAVFLPA